MKNRKLPFGYEMIDGEVQIKSEEADCVIWVFQTYHTGASLNDIAKELTTKGKIVYNTSADWNKNMINRILQDQRYSGDALYPEIISSALFREVQRQRNVRSHARRQTPAQRIIRILGGGRVNKEIEMCVLSTMNLLIRNPELIQSPMPAPLDYTQPFRIQKELDMVMDRQPIDEDRASELIKKAAEAEYDLLDSSEYETERLHRIFRSNTPMDELSADLLLKTVAEISVEIKEIKIILKNNQIIEASDAS